MRKNRMIERLRQILDDSQMTFCIHTCVNNHLQEHFTGNVMRAGKSRQVSFRRQQLKRAQMNLLVSTSSAFDRLLGFGERRGIEYDQIELDVLSNLVREIVEHICFLSGDSDSIELGV